MKPKSLWLMPLAGLGAGLALSLLALIPILNMPGGAPPQPVPVVVKPPAPRPPTPKPAVKRPPPETYGLPEDELSSYRSEIDALMTRANINSDTGRKMREIGALDRAVELMQKASKLISASQCLRRQMKRGVPYDQGKATCATEMPAE